MKPATITVVGAAAAGVAAAGALRRGGFDGRLVVVGAEEHRPYDRPPLIKQFLAGEWDASRLAVRSAEAPELEAEWLLGSEAVSLDVATRTIGLADGTEIANDGVVIASGSTPRTLSGSEGIDGVYTVRTLDDATALRTELDATPERVVVIGAGFIGCEVAATCRLRGLTVSLVDPLAAPLERALGARVGGVFAALHRDEGVDLHLGVGVDHLVVDGAGRVSRVHLGDGTVLDASVVVVGIGVRPDTAWLVGSGLKIDDGVVCDATCTAAPGIVAAGDVARWPNPTFDGESMRIEHWDHAMGHGEHAAAALLAGDDAPAFATVPWFWSDQYDRKVQLAGRIRADDEMVVVDGSLQDRRFVALFGRAGRLVGVVGMNRPGPIMRLRARIADRIGFDEAAASFA